MEKKKYDYAWVIAAICFLSVCISLGFCSSGRTMYLTAITDALNIKRGAFSLNDTFRFVTTSFVNLFFGLLVNKFGTKKLMSAGFLCLIGFALLNARAQYLYQFYIGGILLGVGLSWTGTTMVSVVINRWFHKNKGTITGIVLSANGLGGAVASQILSPVIFEPGNPFGYRNSYNLVALILTVMLVLIILFFRETPKNAEINPAPITKKHKVRGTGWIGMEFKDAVSKPYFYITLVCMMFIGMSLQGLSGIATPHMYDVGLDKQYAATLLTITNLFLVLFKVMTGYIYDRNGMKITMNICFVCSLLSLVSVVFTANTPLGKVMAFARTVLSPAALPLETVMLPLFASELFGNKSFDKIVGIFYSASSVGFALGAPFANLFYDLYGNYNVPFIVFAILILFVTVAMQFVLRTANRDKQIILEKEN